MKIAHWTNHNGSGLHNVSLSMIEGERALGLESFPLNPSVEDEGWENAFDADVHVAHTDVPVLYKGEMIRRQMKKPYRVVGMFHGTPEHIFRGSVQAGENGAFAPSNSLMLMLHGLKSCDACVTFWDRHAAIYRTMVPKNKIIDVVPLGVDLEFWADGATKGKWAGAPSVLTAENAHDIKWPYDLAIMWPWVSGTEDLEGLTPAQAATLFICYLPHDQHRYWFPLTIANGTYYRAHIGPWTFPHTELRNIFKSVDFYCGFVEKGDHNRIQMEAIAGGTKSISLEGNPYAHYWVPSGDQREMARVMAKIIRGEVEERQNRLPVPSHLEMATTMKGIYERIAG